MRIIALNESKVRRIFVPVRHYVELELAALSELGNSSLRQSICTVPKTKDVSLELSRLGAAHVYRGLSMFKD